ncbi:hypothetical protein FAVG1_01627 [Fusarium avenaceum]|nr:hypothetical protein FAVG1_01627 [Fusarium avenaceum]
MLSDIPLYRRPMVPEAVFLTYYSLILWWRVFPHAPGVLYRLCVRTSSLKKSERTAGTDASETPRQAHAPLLPY